MAKRKRDVLNESLVKGFHLTQLTNFKAFTPTTTALGTVLANNKNRNYTAQVSNILRCSRLVGVVVRVLPLA